MSSTPSATTLPKKLASKPGAWLATLQQQFIEGRNCDVVVRVSIEESPALGGIGGGDGEHPPQQHQRVLEDIPCHSAVLASRSRYFNAAFKGAYIENQERRVEIVLADSQAVDDMKLLVKLSCG